MCVCTIIDATATVVRRKSLKEDTRTRAGGGLHTVSIGFFFGSLVAATWEDKSEER